MSSLIAFFNSSKFTKPFWSTFRYVISNPCSSNLSHEFKTALCSILLVIICLPFSLLAYAIPLIARLSLSLPQDVKYISFGDAPIACAIFALASFIALLEILAISYIEDALP